MTVFTCPHSDRPVIARGLCSPCYYQWGKSRPPNPNGRGLNTDGGPARILDALEADGGWLTADGIGLALPSMSQRNLNRNLFRLRARGLVVSRRVLLTTTESRWASITTRDGEVFRTEWRAV
jgi:hypothetical protein